MTLGWNFFLLKKEISLILIRNKIRQCPLIAKSYINNIPKRGVHRYGLLSNPNWFKLTQIVWVEYSSNNSIFSSMIHHTYTVLSLSQWGSTTFSIKRWRTDTWDWDITSSSTITSFEITCPLHQTRWTLPSDLHFMIFNIFTTRTPHVTLFNLHIPHSTMYSHPLARLSSILYSLE